MIKKTVDISRRGTHLSLRDGQLLIRLDGETLGRVPIEDIGVLTLSTTATTLTNALLCALLNAGTVIVPCNDQHLPAGFVFAQDNTLQVQRLQAQIGSSKPLRKRLWQQVVRAKIRAQAELLPDGPACRALKQMVQEVRSGDTTNREAQAARQYWPALLGKAFRRDPEGPAPNNLLNYGYMALRAAVARALGSAGLHPALGLHHSNRSNAFCLADDLVEPLRPLVDQRVLELHRQQTRQVDKQSKAHLLSVLSETVETTQGTGPVLVALERMVASLVRCYNGESKQLEIPRPCN